MDEKEAIATVRDAMFVRPPAELPLGTLMRAFVALQFIVGRAIHDRKSFIAAGPMVKTVDGLKRLNLLEEELNAREARWLKMKMIDEAKSG